VAKASVREFLQEINRRDGTTVLLTTHDLSDIETLSRRVLVIDHGKLLFDGALSELRDRLLPVTSIIFDVKPVPAAPLLSWTGLLSGRGLAVSEGGAHGTRVDSDRGSLSPATAVKEIVNRFDVADLSIEEPQIEEVVKRIYREGIA